MSAGPRARSYRLFGATFPTASRNRSLVIAFTLNFLDRAWKQCFMMLTASTLNSSVILQPQWITGQCTQRLVYFQVIFTGLHILIYFLLKHKNDIFLNCHLDRKSKSIEVYLILHYVLYIMHYVLYIIQSIVPVYNYKPVTFASLTVEIYHQCNTRQSQLKIHLEHFSLREKLNSKYDISIIVLQSSRLILSCIQVMPFIAYAFKYDTFFRKVH